MIFFILINTLYSIPKEKATLSEFSATSFNGRAKTSKAVLRLMILKLHYYSLITCTGYQSQF